MENPWAALPTAPPYVLPLDAAALAKTPDLQLDALPVPYIGSPDRAALYLLALNPGFAGEAERRSAYAAQQNRLSLTFESAHPFWSLDPALAGTGGYEWWTTRLRVLAEHVGWPVLRERLMAIQYFPYHSRTFSAGNVRLPSLEYTVQIVRGAIARKKPVIIARSKRLWTAAVPELANYPCYELLNPRSVFVTRREQKANGDWIGNMEVGAFERLLEQFRDASA